MKLITNYPKLSILFVLTLVYSSFLSGKPTVNPDAQIIIPNLKSFISIGSYIDAMVNLNTIDVQPLRDLSFFLDISIFDQFKINSFVIQNILWWIGCCLLVFKIFKKIFPQKNEFILLLISISFGVYPLYSYVISWGIARKHIMAFFFLLLATDIFLNSKKFDLKRSFLIVFTFLLSILSQPIGIFWPFWVFFCLRFISKSPLKETFKLVVPLFLIQIIFLCINYRYYTTSNTFLFHYAPKDGNLFEIGDKILALGHYNFQIFFPYLLSFTYDLGHISVLIGLGFFVLLGLFFYKSKIDLTLNASYIIWGWSTFFLTLGNPQQLYDTYLLLPSFSVFLLIINSLPDKLSLKSVLIIVVFIILEGSLSFSESKKWLSTVDLTESSFNRRPSCMNAINYARLSYENYKIPSQEVKEFMKVNNCLKNVVVTEYNKITHLNFLSYILFHETFFTIEERLVKLDDLSRKNLISSITKAALLIQIGRTKEADEVIKYFIEKMKYQRISRDEYNHITAEIVHPYCLKKRWKDCLLITSKFSNFQLQPYL